MAVKKIQGKFKRQHAGSFRVLEVGKNSVTVEVEQGVSKKISQDKAIKYYKRQQQVKEYFLCAQTASLTLWLTCNGAQESSNDENSINPNTPITPDHEEQSASLNEELEYQTLKLDLQIHEVIDELN